METSIYLAHKALHTKVYTPYSPAKRIFLDLFTGFAVTRAARRATRKAQQIYWNQLQTRHVALPKDHRMIHQGKHVMVTQTTIPQDGERIVDALRIPNNPQQRAFLGLA